MGAAVLADADGAGFAGFAGAGLPGFGSGLTVATLEGWADGWATGS